MCDIWKLRGGTLDDDNTADELALGTLTDLGKKGKQKASVGTVIK
jgi:hypothetical protein